MPPKVQPEHPRALAKLEELAKRGLVKTGPTPPRRSVEVRETRQPE
jgi:hypothetical protein